MMPGRRKLESSGRSPDSPSAAVTIGLNRLCHRECLPICGPPADLGAPRQPHCSAKWRNCFNNKLGTNERQHSILSLATPIVWRPSNMQDPLGRQNASPTARRLADRSNTSWAVSSELCNRVDHFHLSRETLIPQLICSDSEGEFEGLELALSRVGEVHPPRPISRLLLFFMDSTFCKTSCASSMTTSCCSNRFLGLPDVILCGFDLVHPP